MLLEIEPEFKELCKPVLRKTISKIASLLQVAEVGKVPLAELIIKLRVEAGLSGEDNIDDENSSISSGRPSWFDESHIKRSLDARDMLDRGEHPVGQVLAELKEFEKGKIYELITPFLPAPLLDKVRDQGFNVWSEEKKPGEVRSYFSKM